MRDKLIGTNVDGWQVLLKIGQGASGSVYEARKAHIRAALKVIRPDVVDPSSLARFKREAQLLMEVAHPNVVRVHDVHDGDPPFITMEYVDGGSLEDLRRAQGRLAPALAARRGRVLPRGRHI